MERRIPLRAYDDPVNTKPTNSQNETLRALAARSPQKAEELYLNITGREPTPRYATLNGSPVPLD
jgi:hypothetical protein